MTKGNLKRSGVVLLNKVRSETSSKLERTLFELPEIIDLLVVSLKAGNGIYRSFATVIPRSDGALALELAKALKAVEFGAAFGNEIKETSKALPHPQVVEFVNKVSLALERGTPLAQMLSEQGVSVRAEIKSRLLKQAGRNETRMLIPLVFLILPITVLFAIYPSLELLNFGFI
jgi:tight adherence protein C